jgi:hypothetical protein
MTLSIINPHAAASIPSWLLLMDFILGRIMRMTIPIFPAPVSLLRSLTLQTSDSQA